MYHLSILIRHILFSLEFTKTSLNGQLFKKIPKIIVLFKTVLP